MAKGRKQGSNRHERLLGYNQGNQVTGTGRGGTGSSGSDVSELGEEDVWSMVDDVMDRDVHMRHIATSDQWSSYRGTTTDQSNGGHHHRIQNGRWISRGGLSLAFDESVRNIHHHQSASRIVHQHHQHQHQHQHQRVNHHQQHHHTASSAPVNVPDWSKILRVNSVESLHDSDEGIDDDDSSERIPPREYLAREYERSRNKMRGTSVFEGVGRTLKGRDMSRVRDAVWSQTGFDG